MTDAPIRRSGGRDVLYERGCGGAPANKVGVVLYVEKGKRWPKFGGAV